MTHKTEEEPLSVLKEQQQQPEKSSQKLDWDLGSELSWSGQLQNLRAVMSHWLGGINLGCKRKWRKFLIATRSFNACAYQFSTHWTHPFHYLFCQRTLTQVGIFFFCCLHFTCFQNLWDSLPEFRVYGLTIASIFEHCLNMVVYMYNRGFAQLLWIQW